MKVMTLFGTRPEIIKLSPIFRELDRRSTVEHVMVNTMQNASYNMNQQFFEDFGLRKPDYDLKVDTGSLGKELGQIIERTDAVIEKEKPDVVLILGDTHSCLGVLAAAHRNIKIAHIEAGMRAFDARMPEDKNRRLLDHLSTWNFVYTEHARMNLLRENMHPMRIWVTGNPIVDAIEHVLPKVKKSDVLARMKLEPKGYFIATAHRTENVDDPEQLAKILKGFALIAKEFGKPVVYSMHPRTRSRMGKLAVPEGVIAIEPPGYLDFVQLERNAFGALTDSGTLQEESSYFKVPCVTVRRSTERPETVETGSNIVSGLEPEQMLAAMQAVLESSHVPYWIGDGKCAQRVVNIIHGIPLDPIPGTR